MEVIPGCTILCTYKTLKNNVNISSLDNIDFKKNFDSLKQSFQKTFLWI